MPGEGGMMVRHLRVQHIDHPGAEMRGKAGETTGDTTETEEMIGDTIETGETIEGMTETEEMIGGMTGIEEMIVIDGMTVDMIEIEEMTKDMTVEIKERIPVRKLQNLHR